ncbi:hypothetical protein A8C32_17610 [Flavivirga aquatica]|uniref:Transglutaminase-like domain-containing protein n=1 Tax=Flavivirga aquatica TaxID=1849968 RepID=A0A1E5T8B5_9FLAO|nr:hypothetical protein [Flavivirga aquatica]OEK07613.1 hypothetical protein A8C32_17610 [Flavivirga aquatica]
MKTLLIVLLIGVVFKGWIYRYVVTYKPIEKRTNYLIVNGELVNSIETKLINNEGLKIEKIIDIGLSVTSQQLRFTATKNYRDPNKLISTRTANCIGYAAFFSASCNYLLKKYDLDSIWVATPHKGQLYLLDINIHKYFKSPFFKDHDFVIIENMRTGNTLAIDPTIYDYLGVNYITLKK